MAFSLFLITERAYTGPLDATPPSFFLFFKTPPNILSFCLFSLFAYPFSHFIWYLNTLKKDLFLFFSF